MKLNKIKEIIKTTEMECEVMGATILTAEEYERYQHLIPIVGNWWWLRSPIYNDGGVANVNTNGNVNYANRTNTNGALRPALILRVVDSKFFNPGDKLEIKGIQYTVLDISDGSVFVLSDEIIVKRRFDGNSNNWETSELKEYLEDWARREFGLTKEVGE